MQLGGRIETKDRANILWVSFSIIFIIDFVLALNLVYQILSFQIAQHLIRVKFVCLFKYNN